MKAQRRRDVDDVGRWKTKQQTMTAEEEKKKRKKKKEKMRRRGKEKDHRKHGRKSIISPCSADALVRYYMGAATSTFR